MALWTPAQLGSALALWLDADDASTITLNGTDVAEWADKSGNGNHVSNGDAATQPPYLATGWNGKPTVSFTQTGQEFLFKSGVSNFESDEDFTLAGAFQFNEFARSWDMIAGWRNTANSSGSAGGVPVLQGMATSQEIGYHNTDQVDIRIAVAVTTRLGKKIATISRSGGTNGNNGAATVTCTGFSQPTYITNDTQTWNSAAATGFQIGGRQQSATQYGNKYVSEVVGCNVKLPDYEREKLEGYLAHKWGVANDLPAAHPYKSAAPTVDDPAAVSDWTPADITGLWSWHDWSTDNYRINDNKGSVSGWQDRSANNHDLTLQTISLGVADMVATTINGVQAYGSTNGQQGWTVAKLTTELDTDFLLVGMVAKMPTSGTNDFFVSTRDDAGIAWQISNPNSSLLSVGIAGTGTFPSYTIGTGNAFILVARYDLRVSGTTPLATPGFMVQSRLNGDLIDDRDANTIASYAPSNVRVGIGCQPSAPNIVSCPVNAAFGEVVIASRNTEFTVADVQRLEGYLAWKWGGL
jgi:hypothetical protein